MKNIKRYLSWVLVISILMAMTVTTAFAAENIAFQATKTTVSGDDTFVVSFTQPTTVTVSGITVRFGFDKTAFEITEVANAPYTANQPDIAGCNAEGSIGIQYSDSTNEANTKIEAGTQLLAVTFKIKDGASLGNKDFKILDYTVTGAFNNDTFDLEDLTPDDAVVGSKTLTVEIVESAGGEEPETPSELSYTATIAGASTNGSPVRVGDTLAVEVGADASFQATEMTVTYPSNLVSFVDPVEGNALYGKVTDTNTGTLKIADYGVEKTGKYTLSFEAIANGTANFNITSAGFGTGTSAENKNLTEATLPGVLAITIEKAQYNVAIDETLFNGDSTVLHGEAYTFTATDSANYNYENVKATINSTEVTVTGNAANGWTIAAGLINGDVTITATRTAKTYSFSATGTKEGDEVTTSQTPTYGTDFKFTLPAGKEVEGINDGYHYQITSVTIGETMLATGEYTYDSETRTATIPGGKINGNIVVTVESVIDSADTVTIAINGTNVAVQGYDTTPVTIVSGTEITLVLTPEAGYTYSVTIGDGTDVVLSNDKTTYTFAPTADVTVNVSKTLAITEAEATQYVQLDGYVAWLVQLKNTKLEGKVYSFNGSEMYWSDQYGAYATVVIDETIPDVTTGFALADGTTKEVAYDMDVNGTDKVDANDAQLAYNIYQAHYSEFNATVNVEKFLEADVNYSKNVNTEDAAAIISAILAGNVNV